MNPKFLKFYLVALWGLKLTGITTPSLDMKKREVKLHWVTVAFFIIRLTMLFIFAAHDLTTLLKGYKLSVELVVIVTSTFIAQIASGVAIQVASILKTKDAYAMFQFTLSQGPRTNNHCEPAAIASVAAMIYYMVDLTHWFYKFLIQKEKLKIFDGTFLSSYDILAKVVYFIMLVSLTAAVPFALSFIVVFGLEFTRHYENLCARICELSSATGCHHRNNQPAEELHILSVKRKLKIGKHCYRKYLKITRTYSFCVLVECCLLVLHYLAKNFADLASNRLDLGSSRYAIYSVALIFLLTYTGNATETRASSAKFALLNARELCLKTGNKKIARLILWAKSWNCRMSALGCVDVNYGVISRVFTVLSTYFICYLQMRLTAKH